MTLDLLSLSVNAFEGNMESQQSISSQLRERVVDFYLFLTVVLFWCRKIKDLGVRNGIPSEEAAFAPSYLFR